MILKNTSTAIFCSGCLSRAWYVQSNGQDPCLAQLEQYDLDP